MSDETGKGDAQQGVDAGGETGQGDVGDSGRDRTSSTFFTTYTDITPQKLMELVLVSRRRAVISLTGADGTEGRLHCDSGRIVDASIDGGRGIDLAADVLEIDGGKARITFLPHLPPALTGGFAASTALVTTAAAPRAIELRQQEQERNPQPVSERRQRRGRLTVLVVGLGLCLGSFWGGRRIANLDAREAGKAREVASLRARPTPPDDALELDLDVVPAHATLWLDGKRLGTGPLRVKINQANDAHQLRIEADGFIPRHVTFRGAPPPRKVALAPLPAPPSPRVEPPTVTATPAELSQQAKRKARRQARRRQQRLERQAATDVARLLPNVDMIKDERPRIEVIGNEPPGTGLTDDERATVEVID